MKKFILIELLLVTICVPSFATTFTVINRVGMNEIIEIDPVWSGSSRGWVRLNAPNLYRMNNKDSMPDEKKYDSGLRRLKGIRWKSLTNGICYYADFKGLKIERNKHNVRIYINDGGLCVVDTSGKGEDTIVVLADHCNQ